MCKQLKLLLACAALTLLLPGCWSSKEIEDLALYAGLALDSGQPAPGEKKFEAKGAVYSKRNKLMATIQIVPTKSVGMKDKDEYQSQMPYVNVSGSGDSLIEIFRQFSTRLDRPVIGHHLKVIVISADLLQKQSIEQLTDFLLRDNDIRPSTMVYISQGMARDTLVSNRTEIVPAFHIMGMIRNRTRTSKLLPPVTLSRLDGFTYAKKNFVLQNLVTGGGEIEFSGSGIIKGSSGRWIGNLSQEDTECLVWLRNEGTTGVIKTEDADNETLTYEVKSMKSKMNSIVEGDRIAFRVSLVSEGRLIETWNEQSTPSSHQFAETAEQIVEERLAQRMQTLMRKLQKEYKVDVGAFGERLAIQHPEVWRKVKDNWDEVFSGVEVNFSYDVRITDFGSFTEED
ncbi:Ger(x)C family spore germination protein [Paenibacillus sp. YN15]|uniref:Ger(x)C family spore germination protein n=1 Tax=Paenibacillus sp. YN15 TaxID=1742774 RepID=UPI000DCE8AE5|nr:Ger(x)C family spore germination protein [Paenibacillus sp. YN15]RAU97939.1 spore gernimation protein GerC [Paenibacillus sp. YN15]